MSQRSWATVLDVVPPELLVDGPSHEMMEPNAEAGWPRQFAKLERLLGR